jgi:hypothetical protein
MITGQTLQHMVINQAACCDCLVLLKVVAMLVWLCDALDWVLPVAIYPDSPMHCVQGEVPHQEQAGAGQVSGLPANKLLEDGKRLQHPHLLV